MNKENKSENLPTKEQVNKFEMHQSLLISIYDEMKEFSKKKQNEALNKLKVKMINKVLEQIKNLLSNEPTKDFLDLLDDETLPSNSDTVLIISQYKAAMEKFRAKYQYYDDIQNVYKWRTER